MAHHLLWVAMIDFFREIWEKRKTLRYLAGVVPARHPRSCHRPEGDGLFLFRQACSKTCQEEHMQLFVPYYLKRCKHKISPWYILCKKYGEAIMGFPERLKRLRQEKKLDFAELAERIGIHSTQLRRYEKGESQPTLEVLRKLAVVLNVPGDELLFDDDERKPPEKLAIQFEAIANFTPEEQKTLKEVLEGLILKHEAKRWTVGT
jgi:transcriptional regulator with XRE-family HTH domain